MSNIHYTNDAIVKMLARGDEDAFSELYDQYYQRVLHFARRYTDETEAQDISAEAFVQLWKNREQFTNRKAISTFLFITTRNRCYDLVRHKKVKHRYEAELEWMMTDQAETDFFHIQVKLELARLLKKEIDKLPPKTREVLLLSYEEGLKPAQIAEKLKISVKTVSNQKLSAIKLLRAALQGHPIELMLLLFPFLHN